MSAKFLHYRSKLPDGTYNARGGVTVAYTTDGNRIKFAKAQCHAADNYDKAAGRARATGRLGSALASTFYGTEAEFVAQMTEETARFNLERRFGKQKRAAKGQVAPKAVTKAPARRSRAKTKAATETNVTDTGMGDG